MEKVGRRTGNVEFKSIPPLHTFLAFSSASGGPNKPNKGDATINKP